MPAAKGSARTPLGPIPKIVATFVYASSQGQRTHSARTNYKYVKKLNRNHFKVMSLTNLLLHKILGILQTIDHSAFEILSPVH